MASTSNKPHSSASRTTSETGTPEPPKTATTRTKRTAQDSAKIFLGKTKTQLYALSTSNNKWDKYTPKDVRDDLVAKGLLPTDAVLRVAASLPDNVAVSSDALRTVATALDMKKNDRTLETMVNDMKDVKNALEAIRAQVATTDGGGIVEKMRNAAEHLTRTVEEQSADIATTTTRLEDELTDVVRRAQTDAAQDLPPPPPGPPLAASPVAGGPRPYAATLAQAHPPARAAAIANAEAHMRQILIERAPGTGNWTEGMTEKVFLEKAKAAATMMVQNGAVLLHLNTTMAADWVKTNMGAFLAQMGEGELHVVESDNNLPKGALAKARWIKPLAQRRNGQRVAHAVFGFETAAAANRVIRDGAFVCAARVYGRKLLSEPVRCMKCQGIGLAHVAATCKSIHETCARCAGMHRTTDCTAADNERACANCKNAKREYRGHGAADRTCPIFEEKLHFSLERNPEAKYPYYPEPNDPSTWVTLEEVGEAFAKKRGIPEWKKAVHARGSRGPGAPAPVAAKIGEQMTRGGPGPTPVNGAAPRWGPRQRTMDDQPGSGGIDPRMHPGRAAQMDWWPGPVVEEDPVLTRRQQMRAETAKNRTTGGMLAQLQRLEGDAGTNSGLDWAEDTERERQERERIQRELRPIREDDDNDQLQEGEDARQTNFTPEREDGDHTDLINALSPHYYHIALVQEPSCDFRGLSRVTRQWVSVYPPSHAKNQRATRSMIMVNANIPSSKWKAIPIPSPDITAIEIFDEAFGTIRIINVYNDCNHNEALDALREYLRRPEAARYPIGPLRYIWAGDFNRHHPLWDELRNHHLFTTHNLDLAQPLLDLLARYSMRMALPRDIPTLRTFGPTHNFTRPDNVFCTLPFTPLYLVLDIDPKLTEHVPAPMYRGTDWSAYRESLFGRLLELEQKQQYETVEEVTHAIREVETAIRETTAEVVEMSKPSPYMRRWYTAAMRDLRRTAGRLERIAYAQRHKPDHPAHAEAKAAMREYGEAVDKGKERHWVEWQEKIIGSQIWDIHKFLNAVPSDGGAARIPTLERRDPVSKRVVATAETNEEKVALFKEEFFPPKMEQSSVPANPVYPPPKWEWKPVTDEVIRRAIDKMQPYKATFPGSEPNCVFKQCTNLLLPFLGPIFRSLDELGHFPEGWNELRVLVLRKPGKASYTEPGAHRPIALTKGLPRLWYGCKTLQCVAEAELAGILPKNQFGACPGRSTTDALHKVVKVIKDAWREGKVATVLCMDVKGAFPSVDLDRLYHDMRMRGVPVQHTEWLRRRYAGRKGRLTFGDFISESFDIEGGLDQGDPHSGFAYGIYNADLAEIPRGLKKGEDGVAFVDNNTLVTVDNDFKGTHTKIRRIIQCLGGVEEWGREHNAKFGPAKYQMSDHSRRRVPHTFLLRKKVPEPVFDLRLGAHVIKSSESVKLLGVHIDRELRWHQQEAAALAKGQAWLIQTHQ
ncbi:RNA-directed DNA polymerase from transposon X-element [Mycena venus]|uniref:RNA-directed DNA polymerase from transposon X-element n=1 Tax=Mycena venus TaxID=2733690 RepID=A0A8H6YAG9_9AGAR|nr:RNA-directed DNA polymerase from transposon X-element [Mycena venus]